MKTLSVPERGAKDLHFPTQFSQPFWTQTVACLWKQHWTYWRTSDYNGVRFLFSLLSALMFGTMYWAVGHDMYVILHSSLCCPLVETLIFSELIQMNLLTLQNRSGKLVQRFGSHVRIHALPWSEQLINCATSGFNREDNLLPGESGRDVLGNFLRDSPGTKSRLRMCS